MRKERGNVWLGVAGIIVNEKSEWLLVKKTYSGLKGIWSLPAGFVQEGETIDEAIIRETLEETGVQSIVQGLVGFRSGVLKNKISDNMAILICKPLVQNPLIIVQEQEIEEACWMHPNDLIENTGASVMLQELAQSQVLHHSFQKVDDINPGEIFDYTAYTMYFSKTNK